MTLQIRRRAVPADVSLGAQLHPVLRRVYAARGIRSDAELDVTLSRLLPVGTLAGVGAAVELLLRHRQSRVLVVGDYDADGATSTALMLRALRAWGFAHVDFLVPDRFTFGYGLTPAIVAVAAQRQPSLLVTVDNGISSNAGVAAARALGIEVLVTDHHLPGAQLPAANVIVNPNAGDRTFASRCLAGVGVAFYVMAALQRRLMSAGLLPPAVAGIAELLDLVALGTVADVVPLDANNRVLVSQGLQRIRAGRCVPGITALLEVAQRRRADLSATDLGFGVAPRLNAAGRLTDMTIGIQCLLADDAAAAAALALQLDSINRERREIEARMQAEAVAAVRHLDEPLRTGSRRSGLCLFDEGWHQGVVGLVASRIKDRTARPVVAFARADDGSLRGSARSVPGVHIRDVFDAVAAGHPGLIDRFGGHAMAAGLTLAPDRLDDFAAAFDVEVARWMPEGARQLVETDGELAVDEMHLDTAHALRGGGPWGQAFPEPVFDGLFTIRSSRVVGDRHLKLWVEVPRTGCTFDAIAFNHLDADADAAAEPQLPEGEVRLVYRLDVNEYQGSKRLQLLVEKLLPG